MLQAEVERRRLSQMEVMSAEVMEELKEQKV